MKFGERLRELRKCKGMTQRDLAAQVDVDFTYLSKLENGKLPPPADDTIMRLATALDADPDELYALALKVPKDLKRQLPDAPLEASLLLRRLSTRRLTRDQYLKMLLIADEKQDREAQGE